MIKILFSKISSYLTISLLVLCIAMGVIIHSGNAKITLLNQKVTTAQSSLKEANNTIGNLRSENASLQSQISDLLNANSVTVEEYGNIEDQWQDLVEDTKKKPIKVPVVVKEGNNEVNVNPVDLSDHFRLLLESACKANNCSDGS